MTPVTLLETWKSLALLYCLMYHDCVHEAVERRLGRYMSQNKPP